jgi:prepilin peptidase CpaA
MTAAAAVLYVFPVLMLVAAAWDLASFQIPNWLCLAVLASFLLFAVLVPLAFTDVMLRLGLGLAVLIVGIFLFSGGFVGGGDVKLLAAATVWVGWPALLLYLVGVAILGGILALVLLVFRRLPVPARWADRAWLGRLHGRHEGVPYGIAIGIAGVLIFRHLPLP